MGFLNSSYKYPCKRDCRLFRRVKLQFTVLGLYCLDCCQINVTKNPDVGPRHLDSCVRECWSITRTFHSFFVTANNHIYFLSLKHRHAFNFRSLVPPYHQLHICFNLPLNQSHFSEIKSRVELSLPVSVHAISFFWFEIYFSEFICT